MELTYLSGFYIIFITYTILYILYCKFLYVTKEDSIALFKEYFWENLGANILLSLFSWISILCIVVLLICAGIYMLLRYIIVDTQFGKFLIYKIFG